MTNEIHPLVNRYASLIKAEWADILAEHGYTEVDEELGEDGEWHGDVRPLGRVAFWKERYLDGIVVRHIKFEEPSGGATIHGTGVYAIGKAEEYFRKLGFGSGLLKRIEIKGKEIGIVEFCDSMRFLDFLKQKE